ncbi:MAG: HAMP domain-containing sensor histidine kinase [Deltaproteobacteria bacterium]|nr:HAMP domain-containing sensor histidine kinase [Deltaproteobacteria bacterium]
MVRQGEASGGRETEEAYEARRRALTLSRVRLGALLAALLLPFGLFLDLTSELEHPSILIVIRGVAIAGCIAVYLLTRSGSLEARAHALSYGLALWLALGTVAMLVLGEGLTSRYYAGLTVVMIAVGLLFPWNLRQTAAVSLGFLGIYLVPALFLEGPLDRMALLGNAYFLLNCAVIMVVASAVTERLRRREFLGRLEIEDQRRELEEASEKLADNLRRLEELDEAKARFYAKVNHEFRTPLALIAAPLEELIEEENFELPDEVRRRLVLMRRNTERLRTLVDQVIELARIGLQKGEVRLEPLDLEELVREICAEFEGFAASREVRLRITGGIEFPVTTSADAIGGIVRNLLTNAIKFMPEGGEVTASLEDGRVACAISVADQGVGIPEDAQGRIFELFERIERAGAPAIPGSGVGLAIVSELVQQIRASLEVARCLEGGTVFRLTLPREPREAPAESAA